MTARHEIFGKLAKYFSDDHSRITVLTGAGISAESGIPTFRGPEGYWSIGSKVYMPQEMATLSMFQRRPEEVWSWYLYGWEDTMTAYWISIPLTLIAGGILSGLIGYYIGLALSKSGLVRAARSGTG